MKSRMLGVTALIQKYRIGLLARQDCHQYITLGVMLSKVSTKSTLPVMYRFHTALQNA